MELVKSIILDDTELNKEEKRLYRAESLELKTYLDIKNKFFNKRLDDVIIDEINELGFQSNITLHFKIIFNDLTNFPLFTNNIQISDREEPQYITYIICNEDEEKGKERLVNGLIEKYNNKFFLELEMTIKYYKFMALRDTHIEELEDEEEDDEEIEEELDDYLPTLELSFFHDICSICLDNKPQILILPCLHICHCITCDEEGLINKCPVCREKAERKIIITK